MPLETGFWRVKRNKPTRIKPTAIDYEKRLEDLLESDISIVSEPRKWLIVGRQVPTDHGGFVDLIAMDESGALVVLELKRDRTDREAVSQVLDYAAWVQDLGYEAVASIFADFQARGQTGSKKSLESAFLECFGREIPEDVNSSHEMIIVATDLHPESERVVRYLQENYGVPVNAVFFSFFMDGDAEYLSRSWLVEPSAEDAATQRPARWNGEFYAIFGKQREVVEAGLEYGFLVGGGGEWYSKSLDLLSVGDRVWVNLGAGKGFGGVARVTELRKPVDDFTVRQGRKTVALTELLKGKLCPLGDDPDNADYAVGLKWIHKVPYDEGVWEKGFLANQNTVARPVSPKWDFTVRRLHDLWSVDDDE